jgi:hypothetical protein
MGFDTPGWGAMLVFAAKLLISELLFYAVRTSWYTQIRATARNTLTCGRWAEFAPL